MLMLKLDGLTVKLTYETDNRSYGLKYEPLLHTLGDEA